MGLGSSLTKAGEEGGDEAELVRGSPELERGQRGRATAEEGGDGKLRGTWALERRMELESGVERCSEG
jgi:hypothetical protein